MGILRSLFHFVVDLLSGDQQKPNQQEQQHGHQQGYPGQQAPGHYPSHQQQQEQRPPHRPPQQQEQRPPHRPQQQQQQRPPHSGRQDLNQINQANEHYTGLRARANEAGDAMSRAFDESHAAYARKEGARAKELSNEGKRQQAEMERLNREASEWIFAKNNEDSGPNEVDLHGLYVKEAISFTDRSIEEARRRGDSEIHLIVGKGLHSKGGVAKLKPAIEQLIQKHNLVAAIDPNNAGVLIVHLDGRVGGGQRAIGADDITRKIGRDDEGCVIM